MLGRKVGPPAHSLHEHVLVSGIKVVFSTEHMLG
jgi:hypothetical protein